MSYRARMAKTGESYSTARSMMLKEGEILVGGPDDVRDFGRGGLDLVAILDADLAERRPGLTARERAVTTWMEAIAWARPDGRAIVKGTTDIALARSIYARYVGS